MTIHKSQGATMEKVRINTSDIFDTPGLFYVAISRAKKLEDIHLYDFKLDAIKTSKKVLKIYELKREESDDHVKFYGRDEKVRELLNYIAGIIRKFPKQDLDLLRLVKEELSDEEEVVHPIRNTPSAKKQEGDLPT